MLLTSGSFAKLKYRTTGSENRVPQRPSAINFPLLLGASQYFSQIDISSALLLRCSASFYLPTQHHLCPRRTQFFAIAEKIDNYSATAGRLHFLVMKQRTTRFLTLVSTKYLQTPFPLSQHHRGNIRGGWEVVPYITELCVWMPNRGERRERFYCAFCSARLLCC